MNVTMTITADSALELLSSIKSAAASIAFEGVTSKPDEPVVPAIAPNVPQQTPVVPPQAPYVPAPVAPVQTPPVVPMTPPAPLPPTTAQTYTLEQLNRAGADLVTTKPDLMGPLGAFIASLGVQSLAQLKPEMYGVVAQRLRELGATV